MKAGGVHRRIPSRIDAAQSLPRHGAGFRAGKHRRCADERMFVSEPEGLLQVRAAHRALLGRTHVRQHASECQRLAERRPYGSGRRRPLPATRQRRTGRDAYGREGVRASQPCRRGQGGPSVAHATERSPASKGPPRPWHCGSSWCYAIASCDVWAAATVNRACGS